MDSRIKDKLEVAANLALIVLACIVAYRFWQTRAAPEAPAPAWVNVGDQLPQLSTYNWNAHERTLMLVLRNGCHFCEASMDFYRKLANLEQTKQSDAHVVAVLPDEQSVVRELLEGERLAIEAFSSVELSRVKVRGTPALILADRQGRVLNFWVGQLPAAAEAEVLAAIHKR